MTDPIAPEKRTEDGQPIWASFDRADAKLFFVTLAANVGLVLVVGLGLLEAHLIHRYRHELTGLALSQLGLLLGVPAAMALLAVAVPTVIQGVKIIGLVFAALLIAIVILGIVGFAAGVR